MEDSQEEQLQPTYLHIYPYRFVQPYPYTYKTYTKGRWLGKPLLQTLVKQFKAYPPEYYQNAILTGKITINSQQIQPEYILKNGDQIVHISYRVQPPVLDLQIEIIDENEDFLIINKPPSIIVHTGGGHHFNTIQSLLKFEKGYKHLHVLHRLDKCTSGLLIFAKDKSKVSLFHEQSGKEIMKKMYFARVNGRVQWQQKELSAQIQCLSHKDGIYKVIGQIEKIQNQLLKINNQVQKIQSVLNKESNLQQNNQQIAVLQQKKNLPKIKSKIKKQEKKKQPPASDIKDSRTLFKKVWYDQRTNSTLLQCYPITGRTHQIRVHLQYLGHPILNDIAYGGRFVGNEIIKDTKTKSLEEQGDSVKKKIKTNEQINVEQWDYTTKPWEIMLHSYYYKFGGKQFKTRLPYWHNKETLPSCSQ